MNENYEGEWENSPQLAQLAAKWKRNGDDETDITVTENDRLIYLDLLDNQRLWLIDKNLKDEHFDEHIIRKHLRLIDIEEEKIRSL